MTKNLSASTCLALVVLVGAASRPAEAAPTVDELIDQGIELRRQSKHEQALELFQRAHAQDPSPRTLAQMGLAELDLARWLDAESHLASALANETFPWIIRHRGPLEKALSDVRRHIGQVVIRGTPVGASVYVNGQPRGTLPLPVPVRVPEGDANVQITAPGHQPFIQTVTVSGQGSATLEAKLEPVSPSDRDRGRDLVGPEGSPERPAAGTEGRAGRGLGIGLLIGAAAALGGGIFLLTLDQKESCDPKPGTRCPDVYNTKLPGWALVGLGAGAAVGGGFLVYRGSRAQVAIAVIPAPVPLLVARGGF